MSFVESGIYYARMLTECQTQPAEDALRNHLQVMLNKAQALKAERDQLKTENSALMVQSMSRGERLLELRTQLDEARELLKEVRSPEPIGPMCIWKRIDAWLERNNK